VRSFTGIHKDQQNDDVAELAANRLWEIIRSDAGPRVSAEAGELLGRIGDERNLEEFVDIPEGTYQTSAGEIKIFSMKMAAYPVTNQWYRQFIMADGYKEENREKYWTENGIKWLRHTETEYPEYWFSQKWNCPNAPVVGVSWWEADAFCRWLTVKRNDGFVYRLPTEGEWEAAAAGFEQRKYPFGKWEYGVCNTDEVKIKKTSPVGIFQRGKTPEGLFDMAGNVWEWTTSNYDLEKDVADFAFDHEIQSLYEKEEYESAWEVAGKRKIRPALRGGSWNFDRNDARCAGRGRDFPLDRFNDVGFRCVRTVK
jgi:formylglycine-generating enzyme required for sulfatase activity